ncbi:hypothetical protein [Fodinibius halophilus]|uniref:Uncharacterized protein n=1 Tax=Fodinibius halophilus TaxID=1736908 RepID=A0A6M1T3K2_9BACT|nr:hypothetical protein [Fodinibius halophilus]NGP90006.1 hypothetical protein [Fodinibius halophilus]
MRLDKLLKDRKPEKPIPKTMDGFYKIINDPDYDDPFYNDDKNEEEEPCD